MSQEATTPAVELSFAEQAQLEAELAYQDEAPSVAETVHEEPEGTKPKAKRKTKKAEPVVEEPAVEEPVEVESTEDFEAVVDAALESVGDTGVLDEAAIESVKGAYQKLASIKAKNAAKKYLSDGTTNSVREAKIAQAQAFVTLSKDATVPAKAAVARKAVDPTEAFTQHVASVFLAGFLAQSNEPEGLTVTLEEAVAAGQALANSLFAEASGDTESDNAVIKTARKLSEFKSRRSPSGARRDLTQHIKEAFEDVPVGGFLSIAQVRNFESTEYGTDRPSAGAVANRLNPANGIITIEGLKVSKETGVAGAVKVA